MSDSIDTDNTVSSDCTVPLLRRASSARPARDARAKKRQTEAARRAKLSKLREKESNQAAMFEECVSVHQLTASSVDSTRVGSCKLLPRLVGKFSVATRGSHGNYLGV